jgi:hypothetical protein
MKRIAIFFFLLPLWGCSNRSNLPPDKALLGQWEGAGVHYYVAPDRIIRHDTISGARDEFSYKVINVNSGERSVTIHNPKIQFEVNHKFLLSADNRLASQVAIWGETQGDVVSLRYVDDRQLP